MKVILLTDVAKKGKKFEIVTVPDGYALNILIPNGKAKPATAENMKMVENMKEKSVHDREEQEKLFAESLVALEGKSVSISASANEKGGLFKALDAKDIVSALASEYPGIAESHVKIKKPIKSVGTHEVVLDSGAKRGTLHIEVLAK